MASFKEDDWVQITGTPDYKWSRWSNNRTYYSNFLNKVGQIKEVDQDNDSPGNLKYKVGVNFDFDIKDDYGNLSAGKYYEWFRADHLVISSKYEADRKMAQAKAAIDLQEWENFKKKTTNDALKKVFCPDPVTKEAEIPDTTNEDPYDPWNITTNPEPPDYNSMQKGDDYDINMLDFLNPNDPYFYSDD